MSGRLLGCLTALAVFTGAWAAAPAAETPQLRGKPNILLILADDFGWGDVSCYGGKVPTPALDRMAKEGTRFTQSYVASPICSPSRCAIITGQHPGRWHITSFLQTRKGNRECGQADFLDPAAPSLPRVLKSAGYATAHIGKWHLGGGRDVTNAPKFAAYGYDVGLGTYESPEPHPDITGTNWIWSAHDKVKRWDRTAWMVDRTLEFLRARANQPCFVNLWLDDTHTPWVPEAGATGPNARKSYVAVLKEMDRQLGRLLEALRAGTDSRPTLVVFIGDNGPLPTFNQERTAGLRGSKLSLYEGGIRVPCIAWQPGTVPAGRVDETSVFTAWDFFVTFSARAGAALPASHTSAGEDFSKALRGQSVERTKPLCWEYGRDTNSFSFPQGANRSPVLALREGHWKLLLNADGTGAELYDLATDPKEATNRAADQPDLTKRMIEVLLAWRRSLP
jgi:arylsulfatase A-like enzyme